MTKMTARELTTADTHDITLATCEQLVDDTDVHLIKAGHALGLVQITLERDDIYSFEELCGDCYDPDVNSDIPAAQLKKEKAAFRAKVNREGVWSAIVRVRSTPFTGWQDCETSTREIWSEYYQQHCTIRSGTDAIGGFVGKSFLGSGYEGDIVRTAANWLRTHARIEDLQSAIVHFNTAMSEPPLSV